MRRSPNSLCPSRERDGEQNGFESAPQKETQAATRPWQRSSDDRRRRFFFDRSQATQIQVLEAGTPPAPPAVAVGQVLQSLPGAEEQPELRSDCNVEIDVTVEQG